MIVGLLLAAGGARRFGSQKLVASLDGVPLVRYAANVLASSTDTVIVVVGNDAPLVRQALAGMRLTIVENADWASGLASSLVRGVESVPAEAEGVVVALGDQPFLEDRVVDAVVLCSRSTGRPIVAARYDGCQDHPVFFAREMFGELAALRGDTGAKPVIERLPARVAHVDVEGSAPRDVDTPGDLASLGDEV